MCVCVYMYVPLLLEKLLTDFDAFFLLDRKNDKSDMGTFFLEKEQERGPFLWNLTFDCFSNVRRKDTLEDKPYPRTLEI